MTGIEDFPDLELLQSEIEAGVNALIEQRAEELFLDSILVLDDWGEGTADMGDPIIFTLSIGPDIERGDFDIFEPGIAEDFAGFEEAAEAMAQAMKLASEDALEEMEEIQEWFGDINFNVVNTLFSEDAISAALFLDEREKVSDLSNREIITYPEDLELEDIEDELAGFEKMAIREGTQPLTAFIDLARIDFEEYEPEEEEEIEEEEEPEEEMVPSVAVEDIELPYESLDNGMIAVPVGSGTKAIESRGIYPFELGMALPDTEEMEGVPDLHEGIGFYIATQEYGISEPPSTFPRTGIYIKNRLYYEGVTYILDLYRDLVFYSALISTLQDASLKPGTYQSFRTFIDRLRRFGDREDGAELIESLSQQQAAARGLRVIADHPSVEGETAPWLENRVYIQIVEENFDHPAWYNITEQLYGE